MAWLTANWFWVLIFVAFLAMHLFGHGGHGGGHGQQRGDGKDTGAAPGRAGSTSSTGHQH
jgi:hypothetical protein